MNYFAAMQSVLRLDESVYPEIMISGRFARYCIINVLMLGIIHALLALHFEGLLWSDDVAVMGKVFFAGAGAGVAFLMHAGGALFLWVFTRGAGGRAEFFPVYFNFGISCVGLWPIAPVLSAIQAGFRGPVLYLLLILFSFYGLLVIFFGAKSASQLSTIRMTGAMVVCIIVVVSLLYLWL